jgi:hypothetical protein
MEGMPATAHDIRENELLVAHIVEKDPAHVWQGFGGIELASTNNNLNRRHNLAGRRVKCSKRNQFIQHVKTSGIASESFDEQKSVLSRMLPGR